jgi:hypothetical protein
MPIVLEGNVGVAELPDGNKVIAVEVGPGMVYQITLPPQAAANVAAALRGSGLLVPPPGTVPPQNGGVGT